MSALRQTLFYGKRASADRQCLRLPGQTAPDRLLLLAYDDRDLRRDYRRLLKAALQSIAAHRSIHVHGTHCSPWLAQ